MCVSILFSMVIYKEADLELERIARRQRSWEESFRGEFFRPSPPEWFVPISVDEIRQRVAMALVFVNGIILVISGAAGYFLAGRTLKPIKKMVDEQNRFVTNASHELRTPLTALKTATEVGLRDKKLTLGKAKDLLKENLDEIGNLELLSDGLLRLEQFEKVNGSLTFSQVSLPDVLKEAKKKVEYLAKSKNIKLEIPQDNYFLKAEKGSLVDLLVILLDNAIKYSPKGTKVEVSTQKSGSKLVVTVKDQGIGIDSKDIPSIFDRFYRADKARSKEEASGYGLGLSIAKKIVGLHGGSIEVESEIGKGSTFKITFPIKQS